MMRLTSFVSALALTACTGAGGLSEDDARARLKQHFDEVNKGACFLTLVNQQADGQWSIIDDSSRASRCFDAVEKAGFGKRGSCRDPDGETRNRVCFNRVVVPAAGARPHVSPECPTCTGLDGFLLPCGTLKLVSIRSMEEVGKGLVSVSYERTFQSKPTLKPLLEGCAEGMLFCPERGAAIKSRALSKLGDGAWEVASDPFGSAHTL